MAKKKSAPAPREMTRRQLSHHARAQRRQRIIFLGGIGVIAVVVILVVVGLVTGIVLPMNATVLKVNDREFDLHYFIDALDQAAVTNPSQSVSAIAGGLLEQLQTIELIRQGAEKLGVTVSDEDVLAEIQGQELTDSEFMRDLVRYQLLRTKLQDEYFGAQVEDPAAQVKLEALLVEDGMTAEQVRALVMATDNMTDIIKEYGRNYYSLNEPYGNFDWHPQVILYDYFGSDVPLDWAFQAAAGEVSLPLADNATSKKSGWWLLRVNEHIVPPATDNISTAATANVTGILVGSYQEALDVKARIAAGEDVAALAAEVSDFNLSQENGGELGNLTQRAGGTSVVSPTVDAVIFDPDVALGVWLDPVHDDQFYTPGGAWIVRVVGTDPARALSEADRTQLITTAFNAWVDGLSSDESFILKRTLTADQQALAIREAEKDLGNR